MKNNGLAHALNSFFYCQKKKGEKLKFYQKSLLHMSANRPIVHIVQTKHLRANSSATFVRLSFSPKQRAANGFYGTRRVQPCAFQEQELPGSASNRIEVFIGWRQPEALLASLDFDQNHRAEAPEAKVKADDVIKGWFEPPFYPTSRVKLAL